jgi:demethylmenaquinone methyltransferase/2-methoxy-6-polyprenyl-1,4-benzoquinol methylase
VESVRDPLKGRNPLEFVSRRPVLTDLTGKARETYVREMFAHIARRYDLMNAIMTAGQDARWRKAVIGRAQLSPGSRLLDLGAGTGDLSAEALRQCPQCRVTALDFTLEMMHVGRQRGVEELDSGKVAWCSGDALQLPFPQESFEAVVSAFLMRNVNDVRQALAGQWRVLKPGGRIVILDTTPPPESLLSPLIHFHLQRVIPALGSLIAGAGEAYHYLPDSTEGFLEPEITAVRMRAAGFQQVAYQRLMFGTIAIHWGSK